MAVLGTLGPESKIHHRNLWPLAFKSAICGDCLEVSPRLQLDIIVLTTRMSKRIKAPSVVNPIIFIDRRIFLPFRL